MDKILLYSINTIQKEAKYWITTDKIEIIEINPTVLLPPVVGLEVIVSFAVSVVFKAVIALSEIIIA